MSKRYGRNQRRAARQRIAELEYAMVLDRALLRDQSNEIGRLKSIIDDARMVAGNMSALLPATNMAMGINPTDKLYIEHRNIDFENLGEASIHDFFKRIPLNVLMAKVKQHVFDNSLHFSVHFSDGSWGYAISDVTIINTPKEILIARVCEQLSKIIVRDMKKISAP